jgi:6-phosphogluconolactonase
MKFKKILPLLTLLVITAACQAQKFNMLVGTYSSAAKPDGIFVYEFDAQTGKATFKNKVALESPSHLVLSPNEKYVYTVSEGRSSNINALSYDSKTGELKLINSVKSGSNGPTFISIDPSTKYVFAGNYGGGTMTAVPIEANGSLGSDIQDFKHTGGSTLMRKPYTHSAVVSPDGKYVVTADLGTDSLNVYSITPKNRPNGIKSVGAIYLGAGAGPRHTTFSPNGKFLYAVTEKNSTVNVLSFKDGQMTLLQTESMIPSTYTGPGDGADIHTSADGKFLYASTRNKLNTISIYSIDQKTGKIKFLAQEPLLGTSSRTFTIDPTGNYLVVTSQGTSEVIFFKRDQKTGLIKPTGEKLTIDNKPGIVRFTKI